MTVEVLRCQFEALSAVDESWSCAKVRVVAACEWEFFGVGAACAAAVC